jgi:hypothetical protein
MVVKNIKYFFKKIKYDGVAWKITAKIKKKD